MARVSKVSVDHTVVFRATLVGGHVAEYYFHDGKVALVRWDQNGMPFEMTRGIPLITFMDIAEQVREGVDEYESPYIDCAIGGVRE